MQQDILRFWFEECEPSHWFKKDAAFDAMIAERFGESVERALEGALSDWASDIEGRLALILLTDQFTRNIYRDTPKAFAGDEIALGLILDAIDHELIEAYEGPKRNFLLTPMMHSEDIKIQDMSIPIYEQYLSETMLDYAHRHRNIIARFGRFPHRNQILGRTSTDEEIEFLKRPGSSF